MNRSIFMFVIVGIMSILATASTIAQSTELRFLAVGHPAQVTNFLNEKVIPAFEEKYGVTVIVDTASWDTRMDKILVSIAGGVPFDVVATAYYSPYEEGSSNLLEPLDRYVDQWNKRDRFPAPLWEATKWRGQIYHVPHNNDLRGVAYNTRLFAEHGLDPTDPPDSWESLLEAARRLTRAEGDRLAVRGYNVLNSVGGAAQEFFWFMHQAGISEIDVDNFTSNLNRPEARDALQMLVDLAEAVRFQEPVQGGGFGQNRIAMQRYNAQNLFSLVDVYPEMVEDLGLFAPRQSPDSTPVSHGFVNGLGILSESRNKDLAWQFIDMLHDDEIRFEMERISGFLSGRIDMVLPMMEEIPRIELFYDLFTHIKATVIPPPRNISQTEMGSRVLQVYRMQMAPDAALTHGHEIWNRLLADWKETMD